MSANPSIPAVLDFLDAVDTDIEAGGLRPLEDYLSRFPEHEDLIRAEYERLRERNTDAVGRIEKPALGGRYRILEELGRGGFGEVYLAEDARVARRVAIKTLSGLRALNSEWQERLVREAEATNRISGDGHCPVHDVGFDDGMPYLVMPWIQGIPLDRAIAASASRGEGPVALAGDKPFRQRRDEFLELLEGVARTLDAAHEAGVVHRDVKPSNILVRKDGRPVLIDFGLAWLRRDEPQHSLSSALGTPAYAAPELLRAETVRPDPRLDVWGLGVVLFEGLTLRRPFAARPGVSLERSTLEDPLPRVDAAFGRDLQAVIETALARRPEHRYPSALRFAEDLRRLRSGEPVSVRAAGPLRRSVAWLRIHSRFALVAAASTTALAALVVVWIAQSNRVVERDVVGRVVAGLADLMDAGVRDTDRLARFGMILDDRADQAERLLELARDMRVGIGESDVLDRGLARVLTACGQLHLQQERTALGEAEILEAIALRESLIARGAADDAVLGGLALDYVLMGDAATHRGEDLDAFPWFRRALEMDRELLRAAPKDPTRASNVGYGHNRLARLLARTGSLEAAKAAAERAVEMLRTAERLDPDSPTRGGHVADALAELVTAVMMVDRDDPSIPTLLAEARARALAQLDSFPRDAQACARAFGIAVLQFRAARSLEQRSSLIHEMTGLLQSMRAIEPDDPKVAHWIESLAMRRAATLLFAERPREALAAMDEAERELALHAADEAARAGLSSHPTIVVYRAVAATLLTEEVDATLRSDLASFAQRPSFPAPRKTKTIAISFVNTGVRIGVAAPILARLVRAFEKALGVIDLAADPKWKEMTATIRAD